MGVFVRARNTALAAFCRGRVRSQACSATRSQPVQGLNDQAGRSQRGRPKQVAIKDAEAEADSIRIRQPALAESPEYRAFELGLEQARLLPWLFGELPLRRSPHPTPSLVRE
jgi:hypothetical protein